MAVTAPQRDQRYETSLRQGQVKHALKTALACCLATIAAYYFHVPSAQFSPLFAFLLMTLGMPAPRSNWLLSQTAIVLSAGVSALILVACRDAIVLYLAITLLWIFLCLPFTNWFPLPAALGAMVSALGIFVNFQGTVGDTLQFYVAYSVNFLIGGLSVVVVHTLLWPLNTRKVFLERLASVYADLEGQCRQAARRLRSGEAPTEGAADDPAPFRRLRPLLAPELREARDTSNPFARMILACRALNLRLRFLSHALPPAEVAALPADVREDLAATLDGCADRLLDLLDDLLHASPRGPFCRLTEISARGAARPAAVDGLAHAVVGRLPQALRALTDAHRVLLDTVRGNMGKEVAGLWPAPAAKRLLTLPSLRAGTKLVLLLLLLLAEEGLLGFPGGSQVAFYATFFCSTGNLGRQNRTALVGLLGILLGIGYGVAAAFLTSRVPEFPLLLALVFLGEFLAMLAYQRLRRYQPAGLQAGLALPFTYLATTGPEWGSFAAVRTRFAGLAVAGFTAVVVHAYLWPVLPVRRLRELIAAALRDTAGSLGRLFAGPRPDWDGSPPSLEDAVTRARDLIDDAGYLPGPDRADPAYGDVLACLQDIDVNLEYVHFLVGLDAEHPLRERLFEVLADYPGQARENLDRAARQFGKSPSHAARVEPVRWRPDALVRWAEANRACGAADAEPDPWRPAVIARCLDRVAQAADRLSAIACKINRGR